MIGNACATSADEAYQREKDAEQELQDRPWHCQQAQVGQKSEDKQGLDHSFQELPCPKPLAEGRETGQNCLFRG